MTGFPQVPAFFVCISVATKKLIPEKKNSVKHSDCE